ncbi:caspase-6-like [Lycorma delicatula]|uniref:caspase-6-like n=1 Tax=Lycorma delicatula TaxID=130591 RepID=UPI003F51A7FA
MIRIEREIIINNIESLCKNTGKFNELLNSLEKREIINSYLKEEIEEITDIEDQKRFMYEIIPTRGPAAFEHLISALFETDNETAATDLFKFRFQSTDYLKIDVIHSDKRYDIKEKSDGNSVYMLGSNPKGCVLIINIHDFCNARNDEEFSIDTDPRIHEENSFRRFGSFRDVVNLYSLFTQLGYKVVMRYDLTKDTFLEEVKSFCQKTEHNEADSCVVIVMSHGESDNGHSIVTYDGERVKCSEIWQQFNSKNCPALHGKPKIFIFQICRGDENDMGFDVVFPAADYNFVKKSNGNEGSLSQQMSQTVHDTNRIRYSSDVIGSTNREASNKDFIIIYPSVPGTTSKRDTNNGSWLIQNICKVFMKYSHNTDLLTMIDKIQQLCDSMYDMKLGTQTSWFEGSTLKKIYFNPGLYDNPVSS